MPIWDPRVSNDSVNDVGLKPSLQIIVICELTTLWSWTDCRCRPRIKSSTDLAIVRKLDKEFWVYALMWTILFLYELSHWSSQFQLLTKFINAEMEKYSAALNVIREFLQTLPDSKANFNALLGTFFFLTCGNIVVLFTATWTFFCKYSLLVLDVNGRNYYKRITLTTLIYFLQYLA